MTKVKRKKEKEKEKEMERLNYRMSCNIPLKNGVYNPLILKIIGNSPQAFGHVNCARKLYD